MKKLFILLAAVFMFIQCKHSGNNADLLFNRYYQKFQDRNYVEYDSLMVFYKELDSVSRNNPSPLFQFLLKTTEARLYFRQDEYEKSNSNYLKANQLIHHLPDADTLRAVNYLGIGVNYMDLSKYDSAFFYYEKALKIYEKAKNRKMVQAVMSNMAQSYYNKGENDKALQLINQVIEKPYSPGIEINNYHIKANILGSSGKIDSAMLIDRKMIVNYPDTKKNYLVSSLYNNMGLCFLEKGMIDSALYYCNKSYYIDSLAGIKVNMASNLVLLASIYENLNQKEKAEICYNKALGVFSDISNVDKKFRLFKYLKNNALKSKEWEKAVALQDSMLSTYQRVNSLKVNQTIEILKIEYETEKKNQLIETQKLKLNRQRLLILLSTSVLGFIALLIFFIFKQREKRNQLYIAQQEGKVADMLIDAEQNERSRIARELHDGVSQKLAVLQMQLSMVKTASAEQAKNLDAMLKEVANDVRGISHNLYPAYLAKGLIPALEHLCEQNNFVNKSIQFHLEIRDSIRGKKLSKNLEMVIFRIVQELTNNALKYSQAKNVNIELGLANGNIQLKVSDDGIGFHPSGDDNDKGIGLKNIADRIKQISGKFDIQSEDNIQGANFLIEIPA